jgi:hypothetical protein
MIHRETWLVSDHIDWVGSRLSVRNSGHQRFCPEGRIVLLRDFRHVTSRISAGFKIMDVPP